MGLGAKASGAKFICRSQARTLVNPSTATSSTAQLGGNIGMYSIFFYCNCMFALNIVFFLMKPSETQMIRIYSVHFCWTLSNQYQIHWQLWNHSEIYDYKFISPEYKCETAVLSKHLPWAVCRSILTFDKIQIKHKHSLRSITLNSKGTSLLFVIEPHHCPNLPLPLYTFPQNTKFPFASTYYKTWTEIEWWMIKYCAL